MTKSLSNHLFIICSVLLLLFFSYTIVWNMEHIAMFSVLFLSMTCIFLYPQFLFWILICSIPFSIEYQIDKLYSIDLPDEIFMLSATCVTVLMIFIYIKNQSHLLLENSFVLLFSIQLIWCFISAYHSTHTLLSTKFLLAKIWYIIPFVLMPQFILENKKRFKILAYCICISTFIAVLFVMIHHSNFNFTFFSVTDATRPIFKNHVIYAGFISIAFSIISVLLFYTKPKKSKNLLILFFIILLIAIFLSYTRGTWLSIIISFATAYFFYFKKIKQFLIALILFIILMVSFFSINNNYLKLKPHLHETVFHSDFTEHINAMFVMKDISTSERIYRWVAGVNMAVIHPIVGFGPSTFYSNYKQYTDKRFETYVSNNSDKSTVHNYFLLTLVEQGIIGLIILLIIIFSFFLKCEKLFHQIDDPFYKTVLMILCVAMTNILVINFFSDMIETDKIGVFYFLSFGILIRIENMFSKKNNEIIN